MAGPHRDLNRIVTEDLLPGNASPAEIRDDNANLTVTGYVSDNPFQGAIETDAGGVASNNASAAVESTRSNKLVIRAS